MLSVSIGCPLVAMCVTSQGFFAYALLSHTQQLIRSLSLAHSSPIGSLRTSQQSMFFPLPILNASQRPPLILGSKSSARLTKWQQSPFHSNFGPISHSRMPPCDWCMSGALPTLKSKYSHPPPLPNLNLIFFSVIQAPGHTVVYLMQLDAI